MEWREAMKECAARVDAELPGFLGALEPPSLREAVAYYPALGGKRLRPALAMLACEVAGGRRGQALEAALAVELVHNFSLVHDDLMDEDATRRGSPSAHVKFGGAAAILAGDALFAMAFEALGRSKASADARAAMLTELAEASRRLCEGQQRDMELERAEAATPEDYYAMIHGKTGRLFEAATRLGALSADAPPPVVEALAAYGKALGRAFQVRDDVLDLVGDPKVRGKPYASDVRRGKRTIILLLARQRATGRDAEALGRAVGNQAASDIEVRAAVEAMERVGAVRDAQAAALEAAEEAARALGALPESPARRALAALARYSAEREK